MSVDTRTPRAPGAPGRSPGESTGGSPRGFFDDEPVLSSVKVPSDPAEVVVSHASFRVRLGGAGAAAGPAPGMSRTGAGGAAFEDTEPIPPLAGAGGTAGRRRAPVVWSGRAEPDDTGATKLIQAARTAGAVGGGDATSTQTLPRVKESAAPARSGVGPPRGPQPSETQPLLSGVRPARGP